MSDPSSNPASESAAAGWRPARLTEATPAEATPAPEPASVPGAVEACVNSCTRCWATLPPGAAACPDCGLAVVEMLAEQAARGEADRQWIPPARRADAPAVFRPEAPEPEVVPTLLEVEVETERLGPDGKPRRKVARSPRAPKPPRPYGPKPPRAEKPARAPRPPRTPPAPRAPRELGGAHRLLLLGVGAVGLLLLAGALGSWAATMAFR